MLYDILPPIALFSSLSGIIVMLSRVMLRMRNQQSPGRATDPFQDEDVNVDEDQIFKPEKKGISIFKNRLSYIPHALQQTTTGASTFFKNKKAALGQRRQLKRQQANEADDYPVVEESTPAVENSQESTEFQEAADQTDQSIVMPKSAWRERLGAVKKVKGLGSSLVSKTQQIRQRSARESAVEQATEEGGIESPKDSVETSVEQPEATSTLQPAPRKLTLRRAQADPSNNDTPKSKRNVVSRLRSRSATPKSAAPSVLDQASAAIASAQYNQAEDILLPYIIKHSRDSHAYMLLGQTALGQKDWSEAIEIFQQVIKINPSEPGANAALGHAALKAGRFTLALQSLQRAHEQDPEDLEVLKQLLRIAQRMDNSVLKRSVSEKITSLHASHLASNQQK